MPKTMNHKNRYMEQFDFVELYGFSRVFALNCALYKIFPLKLIFLMKNKHFLGNVRPIRLYFFNF